MAQVASSESQYETQAAADSGPIPAFSGNAVSKPSEVSDEELARRAAAGQAEAFETLMSRYQDRIYNMLARMCGSMDVADDLTQDIFLKAWRSMSSFRQGSKFYTWLYRIALNAGFSNRRDDARKRKYEGARLDSSSKDDDGPVRIPAAPASDPSDGLEQSFLKERVQQGLNQLDADYRTILVLRDMDGMDYDAIADALEISTGAVKSRLHRARKELARILKDLNE